MFSRKTKKRKHENVLSKSKCVQSTAVSQDGLGESPSRPFNFNPPPPRGSGEVQQEPCPTTLFPLLGMYRQDVTETLSRKTCMYVCVCVCVCVRGKYRLGRHRRQEGQSLEKRAKEDAFLLSISHTHARSPRKHV